MGEQRDDGRSQKPLPASGFVKRVITVRIPFWALLGTLMVVVVVFGVALFMQARSAVDLGTAVRVAERVDVTMTLCNRNVDREQINPRKAELELQKVLRDEGAKSVDVMVAREDCPAPPR